VKGKGGKGEHHMKTERTRGQNRTCHQTAPRGIRKEKGNDCKKLIIRQEKEKKQENNKTVG